MASIRSVGKVDDPVLEIRIDGARPDAAPRLAGARTNPRPFYATLEPDDPMSEFARRLRGLALPQTPTPFEGLVLAILGQQTSNRVARILRDVLVDEFGAAAEISGDPRRTFPSPSALANAGPDASIWSRRRTVLARSP